MLHTNCNDSMAVALMARYLAPVPWAYTEAELVFLEKAQLTGEGQAESQQIQNFITYFENNLSFHLMFHLRFQNQGLSNQPFAKQWLTKPPLISQAEKSIGHPASVQEQQTSGAVVPKQSTPAKAAQMLLSPALSPVAAPQSKDAKQGTPPTAPETQAEKRDISTPHSTKKETSVHQVKKTQTVERSEISRLARLERVLRQAISENEKKQASFPVQHQKKPFPIAEPLRNRNSHAFDLGGISGISAAMKSAESFSQSFTEPEEQAALRETRTHASLYLQWNTTPSDRHDELHTEDTSKDRFRAKKCFSSERDADNFFNARINLQRMQDFYDKPISGKLSAQVSDMLTLQIPPIPVSSTRSMRTIQDFSSAGFPLHLQETREYPYLAKQPVDKNPDKLSLQIPLHDRTFLQDDFAGAPANKAETLSVHKTRGLPERASVLAQAGIQSSKAHAKSDTQEEIPQRVAKRTSLATHVSIPLRQPFFPAAQTRKAKTELAALLELENLQEPDFPQVFQNMWKKDSVRGVGNSVIPVSFFMHETDAEKELRAVKQFLQNKTDTPDTLSLRNMQDTSFQQVFINKWITDSIGSVENRPASVPFPVSRIDVQKGQFASTPFAQMEMRRENAPDWNGHMPDSGELYKKKNSVSIETQIKRGSATERDTFQEELRREPEHDAAKRQKRGMTGEPISPSTVRLVRMKQASQAQPNTGAVQNDNADFIASLQHKALPQLFDKTTAPILRHSERVRSEQGDTAAAMHSTAAVRISDSFIQKENRTETTTPSETTILFLKKRGLTQNSPTHIEQKETMRLSPPVQTGRPVSWDERRDVPIHPVHSMQQDHASYRLLRQTAFSPQDGVAHMPLTQNLLVHKSADETIPVKQKDGDFSPKKRIVLPTQRISLSRQAFSLPQQKQANTAVEKTLLPPVKADIAREQSAAVSIKTAPRQETERESMTFRTLPLLTQSQLPQIQGSTQKPQGRSILHDQQDWQTLAEPVAAHGERRAAQVYTPIDLLHTAAPGEGKSQSLQRSKVIRRKEQVQKTQQAPPQVVAAAQSGFANEFELPSTRDAVSVEKLADRVYKAIETRLRSEKLRRGML